MDNHVFEYTLRKSGWHQIQHHYLYNRETKPWIVVVQCGEMHYCWDNWRESSECVRLLESEARSVHIQKWRPEVCWDFVSGRECLCKRRGLTEKDNIGSMLQKCWRSWTATYWTKSEKRAKYEWRFFIRTKGRM